MRLAHLYIHIPFCASRCSYCDFYSTAEGLDLAPGYVAALRRELSAGPAVSARFKTVYIGGGTPTLIGADLLQDIMDELAGRIAPQAEVTVEANPATITPDLAGRLAGSGINRVSLGVQSFDDRLRKNLGRRGSAAEVVSAVERLRKAGLENIGLDLIFGIPEQTAGQLERDIAQALALKPEHVSCYELSTKPGSDFAGRWAAELAAAREQGASWYEQVVSALEGAGYRWYETSNFARPGRECRHNLAYWRGEDYLGAGAGAWSTVGESRWRNVEDVAAYMGSWTKAGGEAAADAGAARLYENLSRRDRQLERLALGLRLESGVRREEVAGLLDAGQEQLMIERGYLASEGGRIFLTRAGRFVANEVCARLLRD